jgi:hypothetical protein
LYERVERLLEVSLDGFSGEAYSVRHDQIMRVLALALGLIAEAHASCDSTHPSKAKARFLRPHWAFAQAVSDLQS